MGVSLQWLGHASFRIYGGEAVIYIDPWKIQGAVRDAALILVSHSHFDHYSTEDIAKLRRPDTKLLAPADVIAREGGGKELKPGQTVETAGIRVTGVPAYNISKPFHPKSNKWLGFVIETGGKRIYYAGDTDMTEEMKALQNIDMALLPVGGTYTLDAADAAEALAHFNPGRAVPYHWGDVVGVRADAEQFAKLARSKATLLSRGEVVAI